MSSNYTTYSLCSVLMFLSVHILLSLSSHSSFLLLCPTCKVEGHSERSNSKSTGKKMRVRKTSTFLALVKRDSSAHELFTCQDAGPEMGFRSWHIFDLEHVSALQAPWTWLWIESFLGGEEMMRDLFDASGGWNQWLMCIMEWAPWEGWLPMLPLNYVGLLSRGLAYLLGLLDWNKSFDSLVDNPTNRGTLIEQMVGFLVGRFSTFNWLF